ncbi:conserved hypothetical protein [Candida dubliniensis CD36]|uniref:Uncharacterized protein n=1 Tax=Candida dubliniensis (strain CD36 / ATCC MYA-646 / CBS 7987 / NCPF 3949 / NRRL Y-17841) TaxID=573826 RepID=B9WMW4_CANDC|nr:conserved hypothetical protein [Candida dubliniensis CD36]CAX40430.1 conserved hypothetical protein [Candida dubliniensis CD36]
MDPNHNTNLEYITADHLSYPTWLFTIPGYFIHLLLSVVRWFDLQTFVFICIVYIYCCYSYKQSTMKQQTSSFSIGATTTTTTKRRLSKGRNGSMYLLNFVDDFSKDNTSKQKQKQKQKRKQGPIPIYQSRTSFISQCYNFFYEYIISCYSIFRAPSNNYYDFPTTIDMSKSPVAILNSISPVLHSVPFNSQKLKVCLFSSMTDKTHERSVNLINDSIILNSLTEFKIWLLKYSKPSKSYKLSKAKSEAYFAKQVSLSLSHVFNSPVANNLCEVQLQLCEWAHLPYLSAIQADILLSILQSSIWSSQPWLVNAANKILEKFPNIDFHELLFKLGQTPLYVPRDFPCNPRRRHRPKYTIFNQREGGERRKEKRRWSDSGITKRWTLDDKVVTSGGPTPYKDSNGTYRTLIDKNENVEFINENDTGGLDIPAKPIAASTPFTNITIDNDPIDGALASSVITVEEGFSLITTSKGKIPLPPIDN